MNNKILAIAINDYEDPILNKIQNCKKDIKDILEILTRKYDFDDVTVFEGLEKTTRSNLFNDLKEFFLNCLEEENVLLIYSGHGQYDDSLKTAYWQPSDSLITDSSSWLNLSDILNFIRNSKAKHISIISDSCYSGALFENTFRGGGINSLENKKSRFALTSGGLEEVSDGLPEQNSPFALALLNVLENNNLDEMSFPTFCEDVIKIFPENRIQTPQYGSLSDLGHDGGCFILRKRKPTSTFPNVNQLLKDSLAKLYLPINQDGLTILEDLFDLHNKKIQAVKSQFYEEAAVIRNDVQVIEKKYQSNYNSTISDLFYKNLTYPQVLNSDTNHYKIVSKVPLQILRLSRESILEDIFDFKGDINNDVIEIKDASSGDLIFYLIDDPEVQLFLNYQEILFNEFLKGGLEKLLKIYTKRLNYPSQKFLHHKKEHLIKILTEIYNFEKDIVLNNNNLRLRDLRKRNEIEKQILNWLDETFMLKKI